LNVLARLPQVMMLLDCAFPTAYASHSRLYHSDHSPAAVVPTVVFHVKSFQAFIAVVARTGSAFHAGQVCNRNEPM